MTDKYDGGNRWYRRTLKARSQFEMAHYVFAWESLEKHTGEIRLEIQPLTYHLNEDIFTREMRVFSHVSQTELAKYALEIDTKIQALFPI